MQAGGQDCRGVQGWAWCSLVNATLLPLQVQSTSQVLRHFEILVRAEAGDGFVFLRFRAVLSLFRGTSRPMTLT